MEHVNTIDVQVLKRNPLSFVYIAGFFFSAHIALTTYINSSFLVENNISESNVGLIFTMSSLLALLVITLVPSLVNKVGKNTTFISLSLVVVGALMGMIFIPSLASIIMLFILYTALINVIFLVFDILIEDYAKKETMGSIRGFFLMISNIAWVLSPTITGYIIDATTGFTMVYVLGGILSSLAIITIAFLPQTHNTTLLLTQKIKAFLSFFSFSFLHTEFTTTKSAMNHFRKDKELATIFTTHWLLRFFETWMIIYTPIYLYQYVGLSWSSIGIIFTIMLLPFVLFQFPLGILADKKNIGRKSIILGFLLAGITTAMIGFIPDANIIVWATILFLTRVGSSTIEVMTDTLFFKKISSIDITSMSIYRNARPLAFIIAPIIGSLFLFAGIPFYILFIILGIIMIMGAYIAYYLPKL
jgi:MFS family permease